MPVLNGGFTVAARTAEVMALAMLFPHLNETKMAKWSVIISYSMIIIFFVLVTIIPLTLFGSNQAKDITFPFYTAVRMISMGNFLEHIETIHMGVWVLGVFVKVSFYYYLSRQNMNILT